MIQLVIIIRCYWSSGSYANNTTASQNTAVGYQTLLANTTAYNTVMGHKSADSNTTGQYNTIIGWECMMQLTSGSSKYCFIGCQSGQYITEGNSI